MSSEFAFTKENLDRCLAALAKEFRKRNGATMPAEIILIGGASVLENYGFRDMTYDVDAIIHASSAMKDAINHVGDSMGLPNGWLNTDFIKTESYTPRLIECSKYYRTFANILTVRTVTGVHLIAMKLMAGRQYKNDKSDVIGILMEHEKSDNPISKEMIVNAVVDLYSDWNALPAQSIVFIESSLQNGDYEALYQQCRNNEKAAKEALLDFDKNHPGVTKQENIDDILSAAKARKSHRNDERDSR